MEATEPGTRPQLVLAGFALLLVLVFGGAFVLGRAVGPVAPGLRPPAGPGHPGSPSDGSSGGSSDGDMPGMSGHVRGAGR